MHQSMKNWKQIKIPRIYICLSAPPVPVALILKAPSHVFVLKSLFMGGGMCCSIQISRKWTVEEKSISSKLKGSGGPSTAHLSLFQFKIFSVTNDAVWLPQFWTSLSCTCTHLLVQRIFFLSTGFCDKKNDHFHTCSLLGCPCVGNYVHAAERWVLFTMPAGFCFSRGCPFTSQSFVFFLVVRTRYSPQWAGDPSPSNTHKAEKHKR